MAFYSYVPATWADVSEGDLVRVKDSSLWRVTSVVGARITMRATDKGTERTGEPDPAAPVEVSRPIAAEPEPEWLHAAPLQISASALAEPIKVTIDPPPPATTVTAWPAATAGVTERLVAEFDALAMTTAVALVQLRLSASVLSEHTDGEPVIVEPAGGMPVERLRAHLLAYHGVNEDLNETTTARWVQWHDERMHVNGSTARAPHVHRPA